MSVGYLMIQHWARRSSIQLMPVSQITVLGQTMSMTTAVLIAAKPDQDALDSLTSP